MTILLSDAGKRYNRDWIFRHFNYTFNSGNSYAITGPNGSGKSTLLQVIGGAIGLNEGKMIIHLNGIPEPANTAVTVNQYHGVGNNLHTLINTDNLYRYISLAAPYLEVIEEMTVTEFLHFHKRFKPFLPSLEIKDIISIVGLKDAAHKQIRYYSSGMKQRVKLAQCIFSDTAIVLMDEPCTNLDSMGIALYQQLVDSYCKNRLVIVSSNDESEYGFCRERINISEFKN